MYVYLVHKLIDLVVTMLLVSSFVFVVLRMTGDPVDMVLPPEASQEMVQQMRHTLGLDAPMHVQYVRFLADAVRGDMGQSLQYRRPAMDLIGKALLPTMQLATAAIVLTIAIALPLGVLAALYHNSWLDRAVLVFTLFGQSVPFFWLGLMLILFFAVRLDWLPTSGYGTPAQLVMPTITLAAYAIAQVTRIVRSSMLEALYENYVRTARSKGLHEHTILLVHVAKNAAIPIVTVVGLHFGILLGGTVVTETIFAWPGLGQLIVSAISLRDFPVVQAAVLYLALIFVVINTLVDISYGFLDPTTRG
jgi:ABC-type dipeptide/oligopeptide/nickel transport system permease component